MSKMAAPLPGWFAKALLEVSGTRDSVEKSLQGYFYEQPVS